MAFNKDVKEKQYPTIKMESSFGIRTDIGDNIQYFSHDKCAYLTGNYITICHIKDKTQHFFNANPNYGEITCFSVDEKGDTILLAFAQKGEKNLITLNVINKNELGHDTSIVKEIKIFPEVEGLNDYFSSLSVNLSKGYVMAYFGPKVQGILFISYDSKTHITKIVGGEKLNASNNYKQVIINPYNPNFYAAVGENALYVFIVNENDKSTQNKNEISSSSNLNDLKDIPFNFVTFTWINKTRLAIINSNCDLFIFDYTKKFDVPNRKVYRSTFLFDTQSKAKSIFSKNGNIYIVKEDGYTLKLEDKSYDQKQILYEKVQGPKFISTLPRLEVHSVSVNNPSNQFGSFAGVLYSTESGQIYHVDITKDSSLYEGLNFKPLISEFHSEEIVSVDIARLKPLIATAGKDRYIKIWNYNTNPNQFEIKSDQFEEDPLQVAFHPNGLHLAALFKDRCKIMHITDNKIVVYKEISINSPHDLKFSTYGHCFAICQKSTFVIYDFFSMDIKYNSKQAEANHTEDVTCFIWDSNPTLPDFYFATCGIDGKAFYWNINNKEHPLFEYSNKEKKFYCLSFQKNIDQNNSQSEQITFFLMDDNSIIEADAFPIIKESGKIIHTKDDAKREAKNVYKTILKEDYIHQFYYDQETKLIVTANTREHSPTIRVFKYGSKTDYKESQILYQANSSGVNCFRVNFNLSNLFTVGRDKCLMIFKINGITKVDKREETFESDLILKDKRELDHEKEQLKIKLQAIEEEISRDKEKADKEKNDLRVEIQSNESQLKFDDQRFQSEMRDLTDQIETKIYELEKELDEKKAAHNERIDNLNREQTQNKNNKTKEEEKEAENINKTLNNQLTVENKQLKVYNTEKNKLDQEYNEKLLKIKSIIKTKETLKKKLDEELKDKKEVKMGDNDNEISKKRYELEKLRIEYDKVEDDYTKIKEGLDADYLDRKKEVKKIEEQKNTERNDLIEAQNINEKIAKEIKELSVERKDKEQTIIEKQAVERELFKENQELEKFKFVLNYKIKELQHEKDPKENKLQQLEKQAKDMDREIKNFEFSQRNYLIELTTNNEIMNLYKKQIIECEQKIERLKKYKKLFKQALYQASLKANNYKLLKKRIIELKRWFLDKDYIDELEKTSDDSDYDKQRDFLEENNKNNKEKIRSTQKLFGQDHQKLMRENMNLIRIVNELEREQHEIDLRDASLNNDNNHYSKSLSKPKNRFNIPAFSQGSSSLGQREKELKKELLEIEKKIQMIPLLRKKDKKDKEEKEKKERKDKKEKERKEIKSRSSD